jgi:hypothetical protein
MKSAGFSNVWLGALALLTNSHANFDRSSFETVGLAKTTLDETTVTWVQESGGEQHELWWAAACLSCE